MPEWSPEQYLQFAGERSRPFVDLVARIPTEPRTIVDLGCGPGHLTAVLRARWPAAAVLGVDSSPPMIEKANRDNTDPNASYQLADIFSWRPAEPADVIISNAAFQWVPDELRVIRELRDFVAPGGVLAFQVPNNYAGASHLLLAEIAGRPPYADYTREIAYGRGVSARTYLDLLVDPGWTLDVWETTYLHVLPGTDAVFHWIAGTGARPALQALPDGLREEFITEYQVALRAAYPPQRCGTVLPFPRVFVVACRVMER